MGTCTGGEFYTHTFLFYSVLWPWVNHIISLRFLIFSAIKSHSVLFSCFWFPALNLNNSVEENLHA